MSDMGDLRDLPRFELGSERWAAKTRVLWDQHTGSRMLSKMQFDQKTIKRADLASADEVADFVQWHTGATTADLHEHKLGVRKTGRRRHQLLAAFRRPLQCYA